MSNNHHNDHKSLNFVLFSHVLVDLEFNFEFNLDRLNQQFHILVTKKKNKILKVKTEKIPSKLWEKL